jgi:hypothetical protein
MNRLAINVENIVQVIQYYDQIKVYRGTSSTGPWSEITGVGTRPVLHVYQELYWYSDDTGTSSHWYQTAYYNSISTNEDSPSDPIQGGAVLQKVGYTFGNYSAPPGEWGEILTADDMRYTYMWGIDAIANDIAGSAWTDEQTQYCIATAVDEFEKYLNIDIRKRVYKTNPVINNPTMVRGKLWRNGIDYTDEEDAYSYEPRFWSNYGFLQLRHLPIISIERAILYTPVKSKLMDLATWMRIKKKTGQLYFYPKSGLPYGPYAAGFLPWNMAMGVAYPDAFEFDYTTGFDTSDFVPEDLRAVIGKLATVNAMTSIGQGMLPLLSNSSVSLDGLSESFGTTQSGGSEMFGARIKQYKADISEWLTRNKYKYRVPISFVTS